MMTDLSPPRAFIWRRIHSLTGIWLTIYIIMHLLTNSQAALLFGNDGKGFIDSVNSIHKLPFLPVIEIAILAIPILIHAIWGILYILEARYNSFGKTGKDPYLPEYPRNHAYTWQRITAWILIIGIIAHVIHMRFIEYPSSAPNGEGNSYMVRVRLDDGLYPLASRLGVQLFNQDQVEIQKKIFDKKDSLETFISSIVDIYKNSSQEDLHQLLIKQTEAQNQQWLQALEKRPLSEGEAIAVANDFGTAELLMVRETFKMPLMIVLYTIFVLTACFHAFNGLWTFLITWGVTLNQRSQSIMRKVCTGMMVLVTFLGLSAVWLTYWVNLKQ